MKAGSSDVTDVVASTGGSVSREEIEYQITEHRRLEIDPGLIDQMVEEGELEEDGEGYILPDAFGARPETIKERDRSSNGGPPEEEEDGGLDMPGWPPRECKRCGKEFTPTTKNGKICSDCDLRKRHSGPPRPEPEPEPTPEPEPEPEPEVEVNPPVEEPVFEEGEFEDREFPLRRNRRAGTRLGWTDEELVDRIQLYAELTGAPPTKRDLNPAKLLKAANKAEAKRQELLARLAFYQEGDWPSEVTLRDRFGSFSAALTAAGFEPRPSGRQPIGKVPVTPKPFTGDALEMLWERLSEKRQGGSPEELRLALYDLGAAAITEADRIGK